ncbi:MAG: hypothetical protein ABI550_09750 [Ignavibacteriaceae bacterium]
MQYLVKGIEINFGHIFLCHFGLPAAGRWQVVGRNLNKFIEKVSHPAKAGFEMIN